MIDLNTLTLNDLLIMICKYNGQKGTSKQVQKMSKFYTSKELAINFLKPRIKQNYAIQN